MQTVSTVDLENKPARVINMAREEPVMVERDGQPFVVMLSVEEFERKDRKRSRENFIALCEDMAATAKRNGMTEEILKEILSER